MNDFVLIDLIKQHPYLYDKTLKDYRDVNKKNETWKCIAASLNSTMDDCQKRFKYLRDRLGKIHRQNKKEERHTKLINPVLKKMTFLFDHFTHRSSYFTGNYPDDENPPEEYSCSLKIEPYKVSIGSVEAECMQNFHPTVGSSKDTTDDSSKDMTIESSKESPEEVSSSKKGLKRKINSFEEMRDIDNRKSKLKSYESKNDCFGKVVAGYLDEIDDTTKLSIAKIKILNLLHDIVYNDIY